MPNNENPETLALGLDADHLVGKTVDDIRHLVYRDDVALITVADGIPSGWPTEIFKLDPERDQVEWLFQGSDGEWRHFCAFANVSHGGRHEAACALIYARRPAASPSTRIRPIAALRFDSDRVCQCASASWAEDLMRAALESDLPKLATPKPVRVLGEPTYQNVLEHFERILGIASPRRLVEARDFAADERGMTPIGLGLFDEGNVLLIIDAQSAQRIAVQLDFVGQPYLYLADRSGRWPDLAIGSEGYRVELIDPGGIARKWMDVVGPSAGLVVVDKAGGEWAVLAWIAFEPCPIAYQAGENVFLMAMLTTRRHRDPACVDQGTRARMHLDRQSRTLDVCDETGAAQVTMLVAQCDESSRTLTIVARMKLEVNLRS